MITSKITQLYSLSRSHDLVLQGSGNGRIVGGDELRHSAFWRREQVDYGPPIGKVYIYSLEDLILYKLMYFGLRQQSKHSRDIAAILKSKKNELDMNYIERWVARLGLSSLWKEMLDNVS